MTRKYYKLEGAPAQNILNDYYKLIKPLTKERNEVILEFKENREIDGEVIVRPMLMGQHVAMGVSIIKEDSTPKWATRHEFSNYMRGSGYDLLTPNVYHQKGRYFQIWLDKINKIKIPTFSPFAVKRIFGGQMSLMDGCAKHYAVAGFHSGAIVLSVPVDNKNQYIDVNYAYIMGNVKYGSNFKEIKKSKYVAMTEEL